ncbi:MAG: hypothetical protein IPN32_35870 [Deltaproteobacteria bacterium]|nr:hypothetical protein [Deltaproteobacteria bacterium]
MVSSCTLAKPSPSALASGAAHSRSKSRSSITSSPRTWNTRTTVGSEFPLRSGLMLLVASTSSCTPHSTWPGSHVGSLGRQAASASRPGSASSPGSARRIDIGGSAVVM